MTIPETLDAERVRADFPILSQMVNDQPLVYFDNAATAQKPTQVLDAVIGFYRQSNSNVHRGVHTLSQNATDAYEAARETVRLFINAESEREVIFTHGTTDSINMVASSFARAELVPGDEIIVTEIEHHSNFVPWQTACNAAGATLRIVPVDEHGQLDLDDLERLISDRTRLIAITHVSNALGSIIDLAEVVSIAHASGVPVLADGAQAVPHFEVDVQALDIDFYSFSGHKMFGPMGIGVLYGKEEWLDRMTPYEVGGGMIDRVTLTGTTWGDLPHKHEAGTPNVAGAVGLGAAAEYMIRLGRDTIAEYEHDLTEHMYHRLAEIPEVNVLGPRTNRASVFSFLLGSAHPLDTGSLLDQMGIAVRTGHHCNQPLMDRLDIPGTVRASLAFYNTRSEIDRFAEAVERIKGVLL